MLTLIHREFVVDLPLEAAWRHLAQVERWPSWAKHIKNVELVPAGGLTVNTRGKFHLANGIRSEFRMTELNPLTTGNGSAPSCGCTSSTTIASR